MLKCSANNSPNLPLGLLTSVVWRTIFHNLDVFFLFIKFVKYSVIILDLNATIGSAGSKFSAGSAGIDWF
jgi:hypothetical protein